MHVRQIHSWRLVRDDRGNTDSVEVIVAHALKNYRNAGKGVERLVQSVHEKLPSSGRIHVFTCDVDDVIIRGEKGFDAAYQVFLDVMAEALVKIGSTRQMLFICHDIASWLVIRFLAEYLPKHLEYSQRVAGAILLGIDAPAWDANFRHKDQLEGWRERIVERLRNNSNIIERKKYKRVPPANELSVRLRWLEACFIDSTRNSTEVKRIRERIFALPLTKDARVSEIPPMENPRRSSSTLFNMNLGKEPPSPTEYDMRLDQLSQPLLDIIRYLENDHPDTDKVHFSQAYQYFRSMLAIPDNGDKTGTDKAEKEEKAEKAGPDTIQRKFRGPESVQPPLTLSPLRFEESTPHTIPIPILRSSPPPPSPQSDWEDSFRRAQDYFLRCELHDADILYDECGNAVNQDLFAGTDIPLRSMFQRAVILIMKGKYDRARTRLERIEEECDEWIRILDKESQGMRVTFNHAVSAEPMGPPPKRVSDLGGVSSTRVRWTKEKDDLFRNLKVLRQRAGFQIAVTFTRQGDLSKASDLVVALHKLYEGLREQLFAGEIESVQSQAGVAGPQLKLVVAVSRLLGLINGYLGRYNKAGALLDEAERICHAVQNNKAPEKSRPGLPASTHDIESLPPTPCGYGLEAAEEGLDTVDTILAAVKLSKAKVLMMRGLYKEGLVTIEEALQTMEEVLGLSHLLSLEARYIKSMLLALSCRLRHAHAFSQETIKIMNKHVSREHPLSLEMTNTLVTIYKLQARPLEALSICQTLSTIAKRTLGARNQQTLRYMFQEASLNRWIGNYEDAKSLLQTIRMEAKEKWEQTHQLDQHPWTMQCVAELAFSYALTGDYTSAEEAISHVLQSQRALYGPTGMNQSTDSNNAKGLRAEQGKELKTIVSELVAEIPRWGAYSSAISDQKSSEPATLSSILGSGGPHHDLLTTLEIWAKIEISRPDADRSLVIVVQRLVYDCRKASCGPDHATTLNAAVDIANTLREDSIPEHVEAAAKYYSEITVDKNDCRDWLDTEHPLKLAARQGEALVKMHTGLQEFEGLEEIASYFGSIAEQQTLRLGRQHPETLRSLLTTFVVVSLLDNEKGIKISNDIRERLRAQNVRKQRRQESVLLRERLGFLHYVRANIEQALQIFSELVHELKIGDLPADSDGLYDRNDIERRIRQQEKVVRDAAKETYEETVAEARAEEGKGFHHDAEPRYYSAWNLAIVLYGRDSSEAEMIQYEWARSLWNCGGSCRRRSTPGIVDERPPHEPVDPAQHQMAAFSVVKSLALGKSHDDVFALTLRQTLEQWSHELGMLGTVEKADQATPKHRSSESEER